MAKHKLIGTRDFYRHTLAVAVPIMVQNGITNFVNMLDNIMVGQIGTTQMSGVSIVNQLAMVYNLMVFGGLAGIGIFTAQFFGKKDEEGIRYTIRLKVIMALVLALLGIFVFGLFGNQLIGLWLKGSSDAGDIADTLSAAKTYKNVLMFAMIPVAVAQLLSSTLRESEETVVPMQAGLVAVAVNLIGNALLIYGLFGLPALGVAGAALATVLSRIVEAGYMIFWMLMHREKVSYMRGVFRHFYVPASFARKVIISALPLLFNETLWSLGQTMLSQQYSLLGLEVVAAFNISNTIGNVFNIVFIAMGNAIAIILGQELGRGAADRVREEANQLAFFTVVLCLISGAGLFLISFVFPLIYNTTAQIRSIASGLIRITALFSPMYGYENCAYFTLRSGGKTWITFLFDSCFVWVVSLPMAFILVHFTTLSILPLFFCVQAVGLIKVVIGYILIRQGSWISDLTKLTEEAKHEIEKAE